MLKAIVFYTLAALVISLGVLVVTARNTVHGVLYLVANLLCLAVLYVTLSAEFLAVIQVLVYAGGIVVLYLFVVMLVNLKRPPETELDPRRKSRLAFGLAGLLLAEIAAIIAYTASRPPAVVPPAARPSAAGMGNTAEVGWLLYTDYLIPFELASILLLVAMIGAIILARKEA
jgi:NADH-quinone oxidoreductase subunit J